MVEFVNVTFPPRIALLVEQLDIVEEMTFTSTAPIAAPSLTIYEGGAELKDIVEEMTVTPLAEIATSPQLKIVDEIIVTEPSVSIALPELSGPAFRSVRLSRVRVDSVCILLKNAIM